MSQKIKSLFLASWPAILIATFLVVALIYAWTEPTTAPPGGNVSTPLNVNSNPQYKSGSLRLGGLTVDSTTYLATKSGNVGIGTTEPTQKLDVVGYVKGRSGLCIGDDCRTSWPSGGGGLPSGSRGQTLRHDGTNWVANSLIFNNGTNVGIGTTAPGAPLHVADYMVVGPFSATGGVGGINVTGSAAELGFVKRTLTSWPASPAAGDRFVWYNPDGSARLWTHLNGDLVVVTNTGDVGIRMEPGIYDNKQSTLDVNGYAAVRDVYLKKPRNGSPRWASQIGVLDCTTVGSTDKQADCPSGYIVTGCGTYGGTENDRISGNGCYNEDRGVWARCCRIQ